jgi:hypothetical protein
MSNSKVTLVLCLLVLPGTCFAEHWYCYFTAADDPNVSYVSRVFGPMSDLVYGGRPSDTTSARMRAAYTQFLSQNFTARKGTAKCEHYVDENSTAAARSAYAKRVRDEGVKVVETDWSYTPPQ